VVGCALLLGFVAELAGAQATAGPKDDCRAVGLLILDVPSLKLTAIPQRIEVAYPKSTEYDREVCFAWVMVGGGTSDKFDQLVLKDFDGVKGRNGRPVFKAKKLHGPNANLISLEFDDVPDFDPDKDGTLADVVVAYTITAKFKGNAVRFDPDIIIQK
jgi:hypothetical protein